MLCRRGQMLLFDAVPGAKGGVVASGAASQGRFEFLLGPRSLAAAKASSR